MRGDKKQKLVKLLKQALLELEPVPADAFAVLLPTYFNNLIDELEILRDMHDEREHEKRAYPVYNREAEDFKKVELASWLKEVKARLPEGAEKTYNASCKPGVHPYPCKGYYPYLDEALTKHCYEHGFTISDAARYANCWEELNPELAEDTACARMAKIQEKYPNSKGKKA